MNPWSNLIHRKAFQILFINECARENKGKLPEYIFLLRHRRTYVYNKRDCTLDKRLLIY